MSSPPYMKFCHSVGLVLVIGPFAKHSKNAASLYVIMFLVSPQKPWPVFCVSKPSDVQVDVGSRAIAAPPTNGYSYLKPFLITRLFCGMCVPRAKATSWYRKMPPWYVRTTPIHFRV
ncbi:hypothetical protein E2C01_067394 [Portunus trituberculatus]|uniref:Uncharacterized protein n=1 Tax=Portunus trituberculatus TaxID=210409 RepID=A0A5B7HTM6_PORTR|nr:hypothetical protein [Portunus trituberculatus]